MWHLKNYILKNANIFAFKKGTLHNCTFTMWETRKILVKLIKMIITKKLKFCKSHYQVKHYTNFGLKVIKITAKSDLDKDHYLIFPPITKNHHYIKTPSGTWNQNKGSYCTPRTPARVANVQKYHLEQWFSIYGQFTHFG